MAISAGLIVLASATRAVAQVPASATFAAPTLSEAPPETGTFGDLDSELWRQALHVSDFENSTTRTLATERTDAYLAFGPDALYCAFDVHERPGAMTATQSINNGSVGLDDYVGIGFDTSGNGTNQYDFEMSPLGVRYQQASESTRYSPKWGAAAHISSGRWLAEFAIPYRFLRGRTRVWRVNLFRYRAVAQEFYSWAYDAQMTSPFTESYWPSVRTAPQLTSGKEQATAQIYVLDSAGKDHDVFEGAAGEFDAVHERNIGIDVKIPLSSSLNLVGTLNPDFSNVETDQQFVAPQEFRYQYAEYRPFFTQGANYLPGSEIFYSPTIGVFDHGEKLEGQIGQFGIGLLNVGAYGSSDRAYSLTYSAPNQETTVALDGAQASRLSGTDNVQELVATNTNLNSHFNYGASFAIESGAFTVDEDQATRASYFAGINKANYSLSAAYYAIGPYYNPLDAYVSEPDVHGPQISGSIFSTTSATNAVRSVSLSAYADRYLDESGAVHEADADVYGSVALKNLLAITVGTSASSLRSYAEPYPYYSDGVTYPYNQKLISASYRSGTPNSVYLSYSWGPFATYYLQQLSGSLTHQFSRRYSAEYDYSQADDHGYSLIQNGQILRRLSFSAALSSDETVSLAYRTIRGEGGYSRPGTNLALSYFHRFGKGNTLNAEVGSPAANRTLQRYIIKYVVLIGSGSGE